MGKKKYIFILIIIIWITSCVPITPVPTQMALAAFTSSATPTPSQTPTPSITPLPTIPTVTLTFDVSSIVTVTPAPAEQCPKVIPATNADLSLFDFEYLGDVDQLDGDEFDMVFSILSRNKYEAGTNIPNFLNTYGAAPLIAHLQKQRYEYGKNYIYQDLTNDGIPELAVGIVDFYIFGCNNGDFVTLLELPVDDPFLPVPEITFLDDFNKNGIDEIVLQLFDFWEGGPFYQIYEWQEYGFTNLLPSIDQSASGFDINFFVEDADSNRADLVINDGIPTRDGYYIGLPWRYERKYFKWNGESYSLFKKEFYIPEYDVNHLQEYRFQIVQDGDLATQQGEYVKALDLYQRVIHDNSLPSFSPEIRNNLQENWVSTIGDNSYPTPTPYPEDVSEYPKLASYAYYRIMLLHIIQDNLAEAETTYNTLQKEFAHNQYGAPYTEMAKEFWQTYQQNQNMADACGAAITYAAIHPEILTPLGSDYHGWQSHTYQPADICPFR